MIPCIDVTGDPQLPRAASYWVPGPDDYDEEGIGYFRDSWLIADVTSADAIQIVQRERVLLKVVDELAHSAEEFDRLAYCIENWDADDVYDFEEFDREREALVRAIGDADGADLAGLELGVAGLVYALAASGCFPAASCRGHSGRRPWSDAPVVFIAIHREQGEALVPIVRETGCFFDIDFARPELIIVGAASIKHTMRLSSTLLGLP